MGHLNFVPQSFPTIFFRSRRPGPIPEAGLLYGKSRPPPNTTIVPTFVEEMEKISQLLPDNNWGSQFVNTTLPMYCLAQCFHDLSRNDCLSCYAASRTRIPRCLPALSASLYLDGCFLRYDSYNFFNESVNSNLASVNCSSLSFVSNGKGEKKLVEFRKSVGDLIDNVTRVAVLIEGFGVMEVKGVFGLAQCWKTVSSEGCWECLEKVGKEVRGCLPSREGKGLNAGCYLRYSDKKFFDEAGDKKGSSGPPSIGASVSWVGSSVIEFYCFWNQIWKLYKTHKLSV